MPPSAPPAAEYVSDCPDLIASHTQSFGALGLDTSVRVDGRPPVPLRIRDRTYAKGLGTHANSEIVLALDGEYVRFEAEVGVLWEEADAGSVAFRVEADGRRRFDSGVMRKRDAPKHVLVDVTGVQELRLVVTDAGDGITCDGAQWAEARLVPDAARGADLAAATPLEIAPFARVVTSDPTRRAGTKADRLHEFPAEDLFPETDILPASGVYTVAAPAPHGGSIGLVWAERRVLERLAIEFEHVGSSPDPSSVRVEYWSSEGRVDDWSGIGQTPWQGAWAPLPGRLTADGSRWTYAISEDVPEFRDRSGTLKVRWLLPARPRPYIVRSLTATSRSRCAPARLEVALEGAAAEGAVEVEAYNGYLDGGATRRRVTPTEFGTSRRGGAPALALGVLHAVRARAADQTVLRFRVPDGACGVSVSEVLARGCVYVRDLGLYVRRLPDGPTLAAYRRQIASRKTVLQRVRDHADETFDHARRRLLSPVQSNDPILLSLACSNAKFVVDKGGAIHAMAPDAVDVLPSLGPGQPAAPTRQPLGGWMPAPVVTTVCGTIECVQRTAVVPFGGPGGQGAELPLCVADFTLRNRSASPSPAELRLTFRGAGEHPTPVTLRALPEGIAVERDGRLVALVMLGGKDGGTAPALRADTGAPADANGTMLLSGKLPARSRATIAVYLPGWRAMAERVGALAASGASVDQAAAYWDRALAGAMQVTTPEPLLNRLIRASQAHCLTAARSQEEGRLVEPWCASMAYGPLDAEAQPVILGMDALGNAEFARRSLDFFLSRYRPEGYLTPTYTMVGTGQNLWTAAQHYRLTGDAEWLRQAAPTLERACGWIVAQRSKTKLLDAAGERVPEYGLMPPGVLADWNRYAYYFYANGWFYAGLRAVGEALAEIGRPGANELLREAEEYRQDILRAYRWNQARMPVFRLANGTSVPAYPSSLYCFGLTSAFYQGVSSFGHDVEVGGNHLVPQGVIPPDSADARWIADFMEDYWFLRYRGFYDYPIDTMREGWFDYGGFSRLQPFYTRNADLYADRDDVRPYLRTFFHSFLPTLSADTLALWEHVSPVWGAWNKTHETGWFLWQTRTMLLQERGDVLWLAPLVTSNWLRDGKVLEVRGAPTAFGRVGYRLESHIADGYVDVTVDCPDRRAPAAIVVRLRHPQGKAIRRVVLQDGDQCQAVVRGDTVRFPGVVGRVRARVEF